VIDLTRSRAIRRGRVQLELSTKAGYVQQP
jgi:hypothetical protein